MANAPLADSIDTTNNPYFAPADGRCLINDLPTELLSQIFVFGAESDHEHAAEGGDGGDEEYSDGSLSESESGSESESEDGSASEASYGSDFERHLPFELLVSRVCKRWREVAIETPALWSSIVFAEPFNLEKAQEYVRRAKGAPLDINIDCTVEEEEEMMDEEEEWFDEEAITSKTHFKALRDILELLKPHVEHWKTFELMVSHFLLMQHALTVFASCPGAPSLEILALYHYEDSEETEIFEPAKYRDQDFVLFQNNLPKLREVALWGVHLNWPRTTFLTGLEDIEFAYHALDVRPSYKEFRRMLTSSPKLHTLTLCQSGPAGMPVDWLESVKEASQEPPSESLLDMTLPSIVNLVLAFLPPDYVLALLDHIRLPNVKSLALDFEQDEYSPVLDRLSTPASGSSKSLLSGVQALKLSGMPCAHVPTLVKAVGALQNLKQLSINFNHVDFLWLDLLATPGTVPGADVPPSTLFLPQLEALSVTGLEGTAVRELVQRRKDAGKPLKEVYLNREEYLSVDDERWLKENVETFELFEGSDDEDMEIDDVDDMLDLDDVDEEDIIEDDHDENWTDEDDYDDFEDEDEEFDVFLDIR